ncbi:MAG: cytidine deaminase [Pseudoalteromonas sp.]|uniref:cytidine deaminase n=1 Tax=unclassified Pseudoalteromonas TaxID=194690 RepID=UPI003F9DE2F2
MSVSIGSSTAKASDGGFSFDSVQAAALLDEVKSQQGRLDCVKIAALCKMHNIDIDTLLRACLPLASQLAVAPVSEFYVGAIVMGRDKAGDLNFYFGANLEFANQALNLVVHAEQSAINNAWINGIKKFIKIAISDAPCGHCRQFMNELVGAKNLQILLPQNTFKLTDLLPHSFGPKDLGNKYSLLDEVHHRLSFESNQCSEGLQEAALKAYVPYSGNYSAVKISTFEQGDYYGRYSENAAYNPSLSPLQSALSQFYLSGLVFNSEVVKSIELLETRDKQNQYDVTQAVLASYASLPALTYYCLALS